MKKPVHQSTGKKPQNVQISTRAALSSWKNAVAATIIISRIFP
jgi:hypothetical protein